MIETDAQGSSVEWPPEIEQALSNAKENRAELERALNEASPQQKNGITFLIANMPENDLRHIKADFLLENLRLAYEAREQLSWGREIPEDIFLNDVLPYSNVDEERDNWRREFLELCLPLIKECKTATEAAVKLNSKIFPLLNVKYSTARRAANQGPRESMASGLASCTGLSIILVDACRSVCIPARLVGTPLWSNKRGNHTWVEIWDQGWHFTGACEQDPSGLDRGWFVSDAAQAQEDSPENAIYAASFRRSKTHFPLVWAPANHSISAENVTRRYAQREKSIQNDPDKAVILIRVIDPSGKRLKKPVRVRATDNVKVLFEGTSRDESFDTNDILAPSLARNHNYLVVIENISQEFKVPADVEQVEVTVVIPTGSN